MNTGIRSIQGLLKRDQRGITGLETAIVLIAFVVVASVFAFAVITTGLFSSEQAQSSAQAGVEAAKSTMTPKGSMVLAEAQATGTASAIGATLTDTLDFVAEGVVTGDAIRNVTDGSSCTADVVAVLTISCLSPLAGGTANTWATGDLYEVDMDQVSLIKFKVTPSPGAKSFSLDSATTVVSFIDANNNINAAYIATIPDVSPFVAANIANWTHTWLVGSGPAIDIGDVVEFTVQVKGLTRPLGTNSSFSVEVVPQTGAALAVSRTTPVELTLVMDLN